MLNRHLLAPLAILLCAGCGGVNDGESVRGNTAEGNRLGGDLILSDDGRTMVVQVQRNGAPFAVSAVDLRTQGAVDLEVPPGASRMVFGADDHGFFLTQTLVLEVSLSTGKRLRDWPFQIIADSITIDPDKQRLALWQQGGSEVAILELGSEIRYLHFTGELADVRWIPGTGDLAATTSVGFSETRVAFIKRDGTRVETDVPNCASALRVAPGGAIALLAPTSCSKDPVSVIDLGRRSFVKNLPGFGPVDFAPDGGFAVAFGRRADLAAAGLTTGAEYSLLFIGLPDLALDVVSLGATLPTYRVTPDGGVVLLYSQLDWEGNGIELVDVVGRRVRMTTGPRVGLDEFVITPDGKQVYLLDEGLYRLDIATAMVSALPFLCGRRGQPPRCLPDLLNLLPDGRTLILGFLAESTFSLYDTSTDTLLTTFQVR
jgi:hypothetical protein